MDLISLMAGLGQGHAEHAHIFNPFGDLWVSLWVSNKGKAGRGASAILT
jgi:hypothetical protein